MVSGISIFAVLYQFLETVLSDLCHCLVKIG